MRRLWVFLVVIMFVGCGGRSEEPIREVEEAVLPGDTKPDGGRLEATMVREQVAIMGVAGLEIRGDLSYPEGVREAPGVILLHMLGSDRRAWNELIEEELVPAGYVVLAVDMRGHGKTGGERDWALAEEDLVLVWEYLAGLALVDETRTAVVGGSIGANMALRTAANVAQIETAVLLSPGLDYAGVTTEDALARYGERPLLIVASSDDGYAAESSEALHEAGEEVTLRLFQQAGHGTRMLEREAGLGEMIVMWLTEHVG